MAGSIQGNQGFIPPEQPRVNPPMFRPVPPPREKFTSDKTDSITAALKNMPPAPKQWKPEQFQTPLSAEQTALKALSSAMPAAKPAEPKATSGPAAPPSPPAELKTRHLQITPPLPPNQRGSQIDRSAAASQKALTSSSAQLTKTSYDTAVLRRGAKGVIGDHRKAPTQTQNYGLFIPFPGMQAPVKAASPPLVIQQAQNSVLSSIATLAMQLGRKLFR